MPGPNVTVEQEERFWEAIRNGASQRTAARLAGFSESTAKRLLRKKANGRDYREQRRSADIPDVPIPLEEIRAEAREALADRTGVLFCRRYFGVELSPWQQVSWAQMEDAWDSPDREFVLENAPPGGGKSLKLVMFFAKRIVLNRSVRLLFISRAQSLAERNALRLRRALERSTPAVGAAACLAVDFGRFKPRQGGDIWARHQYVVEQMDGAPIEEKEPTVSAFGFDAEWIGNRIDGVGGDDMDSTKTVRSLHVVAANRDVFDNDLEPRLESPSLTDPFTGEKVGGLFYMAQQRLGPGDFSAHALSKVTYDDTDIEGTNGIAQYEHVVFKAHYEHICAGLPDAERRKMHGPSAPAYPEGCLLEPRRLPWRDLLKAMNNPSRFAVVYQQEEATQDGVLVKPLWVKGGIDPETGETLLGCWDDERGLCELPRLSPPVLSVVTVDPSVANYWAFQWWIYHPASEQRFLMDCVKARKSASSLLDWDFDDEKFVGIIEEWQRRSERVSFDVGLNVRITTWVLEAVGAFKFLQAYNHTKRWRQQNNVSFIAHETNINKHDHQLGVSSIASHWKYGRVRLPGRGIGRVSSLRLVEEVQTYRTDRQVITLDDQVDANWMLEWNLPRLLNTLPRERVELERPSYIRSGFTRSA